MSKRPTIAEMNASYRPIGSTMAISAIKPESSSSHQFTSTLSPMARAKAEQALDRNLINHGRLISRRRLVEEKLDAGAAVVTVNGERRLTTEDGSYLAETQIGKTAMDYAVWRYRDLLW